MGSIAQNKWFLGLKKRSKDLFDISGLKIIEPPEGKYYADPFLYGNYLFFEEYNYDKGVISCMDLTTKELRVVLERPYHLSFPFIIREDTNFYMIPECGATGRIELWRAKWFPYEWEYVKNIAEGLSAGDTVVYKNGNEYLLFTTVSGDNNLRIMRSQSMEGEWQTVYQGEHLHSRSAGNLFMLGDKLIRPVQDGKVYGRKIMFKHIQLAPYREQIIHTIEPDWYPELTGTHTFNHNSKYVVLDGRVKL